MDKTSLNNDLVVITDDSALIDRCDALCLEFGFESVHFESIAAFLECQGNFRFILVSSQELDDREKLLKLAQHVQSLNPKPFLATTISETSAKDAGQIAKKSGVNLVLLKEELLNTSKLEFAALQIIKSSFLPIKTSDITPGTEIPFDIFHLLPQRKKFIQFIFKGDVLDEKKYSKCKIVGEIYIRRTDADAFNQFAIAMADKTVKAYARRCRSQYLALYSSYASLLFLLTDQSEIISYTEGKNLLEKCQKLCGGLLQALGEFNDAWEIINNSSIGELGSAERAPAIVAYVGLLSLQAGFKDVDQTMLAALLSELGLVFLPPRVLRKIREDRLDTLTPDERKIYEGHPNLSLEVVLSRKLALDEKIRNIMISTHERAAGDGFPRHITYNQIPLGAQLIQYCRDLDRRTMLRLGRPRKDRRTVRKEMFKEDGEVFKRYTVQFWQMIKGTG